MTKYYIPAILFGCSAFPVSPQTELSHAPCAPNRVENGECLGALKGEGQIKRPINEMPGVGDLAKPAPAGWSSAFKKWSERSETEMVRAINANDHEAADLHQLRAALHVWRALEAVSDFGKTPDLEGWEGNELKV